MTDPRTEAARIGFWDEGIGAWEEESGRIRRDGITIWAESLIRRALIQPHAREDDPTHECD